MICNAIHTCIPSSVANYDSFGFSKSNWTSLIHSIGEIGSAPGKGLLETAKTVVIVAIRFFGLLPLLAADLILTPIQATYRFIFAPKGAPKIQTLGTQTEPRRENVVGSDTTTARPQVDLSPPTSTQVNPQPALPRAASGTPAENPQPALPRAASGTPAENPQPALPRTASGTPMILISQDEVRRFELVVDSEWRFLDGTGFFRKSLEICFRYLEPEKRGDYLELLEDGCLESGETPIDVYSWSASCLILYFLTAVPEYRRSILTCFPARPLPRPVDMVGAASEALYEEHVGSIRSIHEICPSFNRLPPDERAALFYQIINPEPKYVLSEESKAVLHTINREAYQLSRDRLFLNLYTTTTQDLARVEAEIQRNLAE